MNILLIAPNNDSTNVAAEVQSIVNVKGLHTTLVQGTVTENDVLDKLHRDVDVLWIASHGNDEGVLLSDGIWPTNAIVASVRSYAVPYVFLNSCSSVFTAHTIVQESHANVICTISDVDDAVAYRTGTLFARQLANTNNVREAYALSKPGGNQVYLYLSNGNELKLVTNSQHDSRLRFIEEQIVNIWGEIKMLTLHVRPESNSILFFASGFIILLIVYTTWVLFEIRQFYLQNIGLALIINGLAILTATLMLLTAKLVNRRNDN